MTLINQYEFTKMTPPSLAHYETGPPNIKSLLAPIGAHTPFIPEISIKIFKNTYQPKLEGNLSKIDSLSPETKKIIISKSVLQNKLPSLREGMGSFFLRKTLLLYKNPIPFPLLQSSRTSTVPGTSLPRDRQLRPEGNAAIQGGYDIHEVVLLRDGSWLLGS